VKPTDTRDPHYYHKVVDCQYACPAHTPVPEYIRLIANQRYTDAYMVNWESNVFPGILGRVCDRPCEPACRRGRVEEEPVAICRLKRVAADHKNDIQALIPPPPAHKNGKRIALIGAGPASLTVARDLLPLGYDIDIFDEQARGGGMMRSQIPDFRLPETVLNEEVDTVLNMGANGHFGQRVDSLKKVLDDNYDAVFVGTGAPRGRDLNIPGRKEAAAHIQVGIEWLAGVAFGHTDNISKRVVVLGGGNTAMDCCRTARRLGGESVTVVVRSPFDSMKASPWEKEDAMHENIPIIDNHVPLEFIHDKGKLTGITFDRVEAHYDSAGKRTLVSTGEEPVLIECDEILIAIGQENSFPWIERDIGIKFNDWDMPEVDNNTFQTTNLKVFVGGDAAFGPENIITAVAQGHQAAISIDLYCNGEEVSVRPAPNFTLISQKMGIHEWSFNNNVVNDKRHIVPTVSLQEALADPQLEVELGFEDKQALQEAQRCLNCDVQTVFIEDRCIECDACADICPTSCISFTPNAEETELRQQLRVPASNLAQDLYVSDDLPTTRVLVKDENVCLHCGLCAERCPTGAWDMQKFLFTESKAGNLCKL